MPLADDARKRGVHVYHLNIGQPDLPTPAAMRERLVNIPEIVAYSPSAGTAECLGVLQRYYEKVGLPLQRNEIIATAGGSEAVLFAVLATCNDGDEILIIEPFYKNYTAFATMAGVRLVPVASRGEDGFHLPPIAELERARTPRTRAVIVGPPIMFRFVTMECQAKGLADEHLIFSLERHMKCGVGKCGHCQVNNKYVCQDGPVFRYQELKHLWEAI